MPTFNELKRLEEKIIPNQREQREALEMTLRSEEASLVDLQTRADNESHALQALQELMAPTDEMSRRSLEVQNPQSSNKEYIQ